MSAPRFISAGRPRDRVHGMGLHHACRIGFHPHEQTILQRLRIDFEAETDWRRTARADDETLGLVDYSEVDKAVGELVQARSWRLIEAVAEAVAELICRRFPVEAVRVKVTKHPVDMPEVEGVAVECWRHREDFGLAPLGA